MGHYVDFSRYEILRPPLRGSFRDLSRKELRDYYEWYLRQIATRISVLNDIVNTGELPHWAADHTPCSLLALGDWLQSNLALRPQEGEQETVRLFQGLAGANEQTDTSLSLCVDTGMYLSSVLTKNCSSLKWHQPLSSKMDVDYGQPVLRGFGVAPFNPSRMLITFGYSLVSGNSTGGSDLLKLYLTWRSLITSAR
jgi:hypothetical protein